MKNILIKIKNHWNYVADPKEPEDVKIFSKEWFVFILYILGVLGVLTLLTFLCGIFNADVDKLLSLLIFGGFCFVAGMVFENFL